MCYVGKTRRHLQVRFKEHLAKKGPVKAHLQQCFGGITEESVDILGATSRGEISVDTGGPVDKRIEAIFEYSMRSRDLKLTI